ncbi:reverse transcriptase domain-containing protein [Actinokineospora sp. UTMC 2448]|uniref:reverse transcriptase domain-containing protein n=1 Tax=Actinokineospora sp. UTMC 2448 TaxID=2268449 RepID=UPI002164C9F7|nr:reverse transcriptase domain-containing protein [Actinokineospora sp. UTMC 2448]UVS76339.1 Retron-type reverse transcriptase [Actinokineospora sp. UTMC 2448]
MRPVELRVVARMLDIPLHMVRRWCETGVLPSLSYGGHIYVDEMLLSSALTEGGKSISPQRLEFATALTEIEAQDLKEVWIPDIVRHADLLQNRFVLISESIERLRDLRFDSVTSVEVPKTPFFARTGHLLSLHDRLSYHVAVRRFAIAIDRLLPSVVFSSRIDDAVSSYLLKRGVNQWQKWGRYVRRQVKQGNEWLIKTDLASYFDTVTHEYLLNDLRALGVSADWLTPLEAMLSQWETSPGHGLVQGPDVSRVLGNFYMLPVDRAMLEAGFNYSRYMDDVRIVAATRSQSIAAMRLFERECKKRGLIASSQKTSLLMGKDALNADLNSMRDHITYLFDTRRYRQARPLLRAMLNQELKKSEGLDLRATKFSLYRLSRIRDSKLIEEVLGRLDALSPVAHVVAEYLSHFVDQIEVRQAIDAYLTNEESSLDPYVMYYLFALMLACPRESISTAWVDAARSVARDRNKHDYLRIIATNVLARKRDSVDLAWIRTSAQNDNDHAMIRGYLVALKRAGQLDLSTVNRYAKRGPSLARVIGYLTSVTKLPSLVNLHRELFAD